MTLNGNKFVKVSHVFVEGRGCFFQTRDIAIDQGTSANGVGLWVETIEFDGQTWFRAGNENVWS